MDVIGAKYDERRAREQDSRKEIEELKFKLAEAEEALKKKDTSVSLEWRWEFTFSCHYFISNVNF